MLELAMKTFFAPRGVAIVGASSDPTKLGYGLARNLALSSYPGAVHLVNPQGGSLFGRPVYQRISQAPDPIDLALLLIPAAAIPSALKECGERGLRAAVIMAGGFRETGAHGAALETECLEIARSYGMRLLGPNSVGLLDTHLPLNATFLPQAEALPGEVAFISHSGAICAAILDWAAGQGLGFSRLISLGNQADLNETDALAAIAGDPATRVLTMYLEGIGDGRRFIEVASQVARQKPIVALKVGRFPGGQQAAASHTGALAGEEHAYAAAFQRTGVLRAATSQELFDWARALAWCPPPAGCRAAILTNAGGPGVTAADAIELNGLRLAQFSPATTQSLAALLPPAANLKNPVDMLASASPEQYSSSLRLLLNDPGVDSVMVILPAPPMHPVEGVAQALIPVIQAAAKPVVIALMGERLVQSAAGLFRAAKVADYRFPEQAAAALGALAAWAEQRDLAPARRPDGLDRQQAEQILAGCSLSAPGFLPNDTAAGLLRAYGIPVPQASLAKTAPEAVLAAGRCGYPVALKIVSPDIAHKSDVGGIALNLQTPKEVQAGFARVMENARTARPEARLEGALVQQMTLAGQEVIIGAIQNPQFGPLVMFGSGGVEVEGLKDICFRLAPLPVEEAEQMLESTWAGRKLAGFRNLPPADRTAVLDCLVRLAWLAADFPQLAEIEINPLRVLATGQGASAVDIRIRAG
jgi:acetyltransferase